MTKRTDKSRIARIVIRLVVLATSVVLICVGLQVPPTLKPAIIGLSTTLVLAIFVGPITNVASWGYDRPEESKSLRNFTIAHDSPGPLMLGFMEAVLFYATLVEKAWAAIGGWLVFKAAAKWASWQHVVKLPDKWPNDAFDDVDYASARHDWGTRDLTRFLTGTLANLLVALAGAATYWLVGNY